MTAHNRLAVILLLGTTQTLGWASSFYLPAILGDRIANDLEMSSTWFFAAFSGALVVSALVGPRAGRTVDAVGGRGARRIESDPSGRTRAPGLCSFTGHVVVGLADPRSRDGHRAL